MPRPRLHKSSFVVASTVAVWLVLVNVPGRVTLWQPASFFTYEHGWPWVYLKRETLDDAKRTSGSRVKYAYRRDAMQNVPGLGVPWLCAPNWKFWEAIPSRNGWSWDCSGRILFANGAIAIALVVGSVAAWEWRRRRRNGWIHFSLAEIFLVVTLLSTVLCWIVHMKRDFTHEMQVEETYMALDCGWDVEDHKCIAPVWVRSLIGEKLLPEFTWRVATVSLDADVDAPPPEKICQQISALSYIHTVSVDTFLDDGPHFPFSKLRALKRLRALEVDSNRPLHQQDVDELSQLVRLNVLAVSAVNDDAPAIISRLKAALPGCRIVNIYEDDYYDYFPDIMHTPSAFFHPAHPAQ